ncbi:MAG TPA: response regulator transcription factor [Thermoanaerobaculia bacterium]|nr:response regulator transcription factor [Thermoanaerobaculia bacterium]
MIRIFIADDQALVREGIRALLQTDLEFVIAGEAPSGSAAIASVTRSAVDVLLLDVRMPDKNGIDVIRELAQKEELPPTLILTTFDDDAAVIDGIRSGARGFLLKDASFEQLASAIRALASGATAFQPATAERLFHAPPAHRMNDDRLTGRETEVVRLMAGGFSNKEIAHALRTAEGTIKNHVSNILAKLGARDRTRAVLRALERGLL